MPLHTIDKAGTHDSMQITGTNRNLDIGLKLVNHDLEKTLYIPELNISNVFVPLVKYGNGRVRIDTLITSKFGGDNLNLHGSGLSIGTLYQRDNTPTRPYAMHALLKGESVRNACRRLDLDVYDPSLLEPVEYPAGSGRFVIPFYHVDGILQAYKLLPNGTVNRHGVISDVYIPNIDADLKGSAVQGIIGSEACRYRRWELGTKHLRIRTENRNGFSIIFNTLEDSTIGNNFPNGVDLQGNIRLRERKPSLWGTHDVAIKGVSHKQLDIQKGSPGMRVLPYVAYVKPKLKSKLKPKEQVQVMDIQSYTDEFNFSFKKLIGHEGKFTNHRKDRGNWTSGRVGVGELKGTMFGISAMSYPDLHIRNLTLDQAKAIYFRDFWSRLDIPSMPSVFRFQLFDTAVNSGPGNAARILQRAVGVAADGDIGPLTMKAVGKHSGATLISLFNGKRLDFMTRLSTWSIFGKGWARRIAANLAVSNSTGD